MPNMATSRICPTLCLIWRRCQIRQLVESVLDCANFGDAKCGNLSSLRQIWKMYELPILARNKLAKTEIFMMAKMPLSAAEVATYNSQNCRLRQIQKLPVVALSAIRQKA